jgi:hypothetical protein
MRSVSCCAPLAWLVQGHAACMLSAALPPRSGKSELAALVADTLAKDADCRAHVVWVACGDVRSEPLTQAQQQLAPLVRLGTPFL